MVPLILSSVVPSCTSTGLHRQRSECHDFPRAVMMTTSCSSSLSQLKCCGFTNYTDFVGSKFEADNGGGLPPSCCWTNSTPCSSAEAERSNVQVRIMLV